MCVIIDTNVAHKMNGEFPEGAAVLLWLLKGSGKLVISSELFKEIRDQNFRSMISELERAGKLCRQCDIECETEKLRLIGTNLMVSDDPHILALVNTSQCNLIFTHDKNLHKDLGNRNLIHMKCSIYQTADHRHLLDECTCA